MILTLSVALSLSLSVGWRKDLVESCRHVRTDLPTMCICSLSPDSEQMRRNEVRKAKEARIVQLTKRMENEKQPKKKRELFEEIARIRESSDGIERSRIPIHVALS